MSELTGEKRQLVFQGRALPYKPFTVKGTMRAEFTWYPGNPTASIQMLGSKEEPTTIRGKWKDRFIGTSNEFLRPVTPTGFVFLSSGAGQNGVSQQLTSCQAIVRAVDSVRRAGQYLRVTWGDVIREGILSAFTVTWERQDVAEWEMEFTWGSQGEAQIAPSLPNPPTVGDFSAQLTSLSDKLASVIAPPFNAAESFLSLVSSSADTIQDASFQMANAVSGTTKTIYTPQETAERALALAQAVQADAEFIKSTIESTPPSEVVSRDLATTVSTIGTTLTGGTSVTTLTLGESLAVSNYTRALKKAAQDLINLCASSGEELRASVRQEDLLATFLARAPGDLRDVASEFYGSPDDWRTILRYNRMTSSKLARGQLVLVPKQQSTDRRV